MMQMQKVGLSLSRFCKLFVPASPYCSWGLVAPQTVKLKYLPGVINRSGRNSWIRLCQTRYCATSTERPLIRPEGYPVTTTKIVVEILFPQKKNMDPTRLELSSAILRYRPGDERYQLSLLLKSGKIFNFDRPVQESLQVLEERIKLNMAKKLKGSEITAKVLLSAGFEYSDPVKLFLDHLVSKEGEAQIEINNKIFDVSVNPPEVFCIKFRENPLAGFPFHPVKIDASDNFQQHSSIFKWEYTKNENALSKVKNKKGNNKSDNNSWLPCGDNSPIITPNSDLVGAFLRLTCTPSDGHGFGTTVISEVETPVQKLPVDRLLYDERLQRLDAIDSSDPNVLRFVSYNILADTYATEEWFTASPAESLKESYRIPLIENELRSYRGDVLCLQEVEDRTFKSELEPFLTFSGGYEGVFSCKIGNTREGVATFVNKKKLSILESTTVELSSAIAALPSWDRLQQNEELSEALKARNTILQLVVLQNKNEDNSLMLLAVTHLYFRPDADHIRLLQTIACVRSIQVKLDELKVAYPERKIRVFFAGDFNCTPPFSSYRLLTSGKVEADDEDWMSCEAEKITPGIAFEHQLHLTDSHPNNDELLTNITLSFEGCIDYILFQQNSAEVIRSYPPPTKASIAALTNCAEVHHLSLPNFYTPSDHLPLIVDFKLV